MPPINPANAIAAYSNTARAAVPSGELKPPTGQSFANLVENASDQAMQSLQAGEKASIQAMSGKADLADVVTAVSNAEVTLQTVVAVRDRVVSAYLDILKMPI
ncbi:MAG TPA: flagellar hook-basal body complex protein FliE [Candidatus Sulfotelmatobacter sp.]|nr:flagellar hook-basal body complex protein FliE [Candidatus Sulfotelmatobacter sp.]